MSSAFVSIVLSLLLIASTKIGKTEFVTSLFQQLFYPIQAPTSTIHNYYSYYLSYFSSLPQLSVDNERLSRENQDLKIAFKKIKEDQKITQVDFVTNYKQTVPLRLVGTGQKLLFTTKDLTNVTKGQPIIVHNQLIGLVDEVVGQVIKVTPIDNFDNPLAIQLENGIKGSYKVEGDIPVVFSLPSDTSYTQHTLVLTLPTPQIPENLVVGEIDQIISSSADPFQKAKVNLSKNTSENFLLILQP